MGVEKLQKRVNISSGNLLLWCYLSHFILKFAIRGISWNVFLCRIGYRNVVIIIVMGSSINYRMWVWDFYAKFITLQIYKWICGNVEESY